MFWHNILPSRNSGDVRHEWMCKGLFADWLLEIVGVELASSRRELAALAKA
jgi:hypothetical protein